MELRGAIKQEIDKFLKVNHTWETQYLEWLANAVMVKKSNDK